MSKNDHKILGVAPDATISELKARWRELALVHHPDYGGDPVEFNCLRTAYDSALITAVHCRRCKDTGRVTITSGFERLSVVCACKGGVG